MRGSTFLGAIILTLACEGGGLPLPGPNPPLTTFCGGSSVTLKVVGSATPEFSWTPNCRVALLIVETSSTGADQWVISLSSGFNGPVSYGVAPADAATTKSAVALTPGTSYRVVMFADVEGKTLVGAGPITP